MNIDSTSKLKYNIQKYKKLQDEFYTQSGDNFRKEDLLNEGFSWWKAELQQTWISQIVLVISIFSPIKYQIS